MLTCAWHAVKTAREWGIPLPGPLPDPPPLGEGTRTRAAVANRQYLWLERFPSPTRRARGQGWGLHHRRAHSLLEHRASHRRTILAWRVDVAHGVALNLVGERRSSRIERRVLESRA